MVGRRSQGFVGDCLKRTVHIASNPALAARLAALCTVCEQYTASLRFWGGFDAICTPGTAGSRDPGS